MTDLPSSSQNFLLDRSLSLSSKHKPGFSLPLPLRSSLPTRSACRPSRVGISFALSLFVSSSSRPCSVSLDLDLRDFGSGGKLKPLKQPKSEKKEYDEVRAFCGYIRIVYIGGELSIACLVESLGVSLSA